MEIQFCEMMVVVGVHTIFVMVVIGGYYYRWLIYFFFILVDATTGVG